MKILYAANNSTASKIQLRRFLDAIQDKPYNIKIAAFKKSSPRGVSIDWTLDSLINIFKPQSISFKNENLSIYYEQVKQFSPDLIISDLEYFTSHIANILNIKIWQCSSALINFALTKKQKYNLGVFKHHAYSFNKDPLQVQRLVNMLENSDHNLIYSHFGDVENKLEIHNNFEWIRPYYKIGQTSIPCQHNIIGVSPDSNKKIINILEAYPDSVFFSEYYNEKYKNVITKDIENQSEYFCNLRNSNALICEGQTGFLADAFYNNKMSIIYTNYTDNECILNGIISNYLKISISDIQELSNKSIHYQLNPDIMFLHEKIERTLI